MAKEGKARGRGRGKGTGEGGEMCKYNSKRTGISRIYDN